MTKQVRIQIVVGVLAATTMLIVIICDTFANQENKIFSSSTANKHLAYPALTNNSNLKYNPAHGLPGHRCDIPDGAPLPQSDSASMLAASSLTNMSLKNSPENQSISNLSQVADNLNPDSASSNGAVNPAHGEPGHKCGIPVGAPLNSDAIQPNTANNQTAPAINQPTNTSGVTPTLNPAHGQPGHRCDIGVGSPLNSPAVKTNTATATPAVKTNAPVASPINFPVVNSNAPAASATVNPAHGQPGHRCDIAVGSPLNSPAVKTTTSDSSSSTNSKTELKDLVKSQTAVSSDTSNVRLNPPHGQPGHDCSIQAGKPLPKKQ